METTILSPDTIRGLSDDALFELLFTEEDRLTRHVVDEIVLRREQFTTRLIELLIDPENWDDESSTWWPCIHATYILGAIDDPLADEALLAAMHQAQYRECDWVSVTIPPILGRRGARIRPALTQIAIDPSQDSMVRADALYSLGATTIQESEGAPAVFATIATVFQDAQNDELVRSIAGSVLLDFQIAEQRDALFAFAEESKDSDPATRFYTKDEIEASLAEPPDTHLYVKDWLPFYAEEEIAKRQARWAAEDAADAPGDDGEDDAGCDNPHCDEHHEARVPIRVEPKVGRNDPCSCGSGAKYKKCCGK